MRRRYNIAQIGTFDLENYGDLLFPFVLENELRKKIDIANFVLFSPIGGKMPFNPETFIYQISELDRLHMRYHFDAIIIGGGDIIRLDQHVADEDKYNVKGATLDLWIYPTIIANKYNIPIIWNCPGVPFAFEETQKPLVRSVLGCIDYISVRDMKSKNLLNFCYEPDEILVYPDSVTVISNLINKEDNEKMFKKLCYKLPFLKLDSYIIFQIGSFISDGDDKVFADFLLKIKEEFNLQIVLLPIGYVHNDAIMVNRILSFYPDEFLMVDKKISPMEMISIISHSKCFIGSSLHGSITAFSYNIKCIAINHAQLTKIDGFYDAIDRNADVLKDPMELYQIFRDVWNRIEDNKSRIFELMDDHLFNITQLILNRRKIKDIPEETNALIERLYFLQKNEKFYKEAHTFTVNLYWNIGQGFNEHDKKSEIQTSLMEGNCQYYKEFQLPSETRSIRFDPVEGKFCVVKNLQIVTNNGVMVPTNINGIKIDEFDIFETTDPQYVVDFGGRPTQWVKIRASIYLFQEMDIQLLMAKFHQISILEEEINKTKTAMQAAILQKDEAMQAAILQKDEAMQAAILQKDQAIQEIVNQYKKNQQENSEKVTKLSEELDHYKTHYFAAINQRTDLTNQLRTIYGMYQMISNSVCWKITKPLRLSLDIIKRLLKSTRPTTLFYKGLVYLKHHGVKATMKKMQFRKKQQNASKNYEVKNAFTEADRKEQENTTFSKIIKFSILVPLYNTPVKYLREMVDSVQKQTYKNWELCLADGSDEEHDEVRRTCKAIVKKDSRIHYKQLEKNFGISGNTNQCIDMAQGDYIALLDHDDLLHPAALFENMKAICEKNADFIYTDENTFSQTPDDAYCPHFKPDFAADNLRSNNYICHFTVFSRRLHERVGGFRTECDGSQDYDMVLRLTEQAAQIVHIPKILYYWRAHQNSVASDVSAKPYVIEAAKKAIADHLERVGLSGEVCNSSVISTYKINYQIEGRPLISILIPNKDHIDDLDICLSSILEKSTYSNYEIIIIENNSTKKETFDYYDSLKGNDKIHVIFWGNEFNYSAINNFGFKSAKGDFILLLNNDVKIITPNWLEEMLMFIQREDVGAVGAKLYYPDDTVQHAGICIGMLTLAGHYHRNFPRAHPGYMARLSYAQDVSAVTGACMMISRKVYEEVNGLDEIFQVAFNDVDLCMRIRKAGYLIIFTPFAELYHYESKSRGLEDTPEKRQRFEGEVLLFQKRWVKELAAGDPYYNPNFTLDREDFSIQ